MKAIFPFLCLLVTVLINRHATGQATTSLDPFEPHTWTATVKVVDEDGNPVAGSDVSVQYTIPATASSGPTYGEVKGLTDGNGMYIASHTDRSWDLGATVQKAGYYATHIGHQFYFDADRLNPTFTLMLKKIAKPIPMYAKSITYLPFPVFNVPIGYDLAIGDWVAPYGKGINKDILFTENHIDASSGYTFTVSFPNPGDGIKGLDRDWSLGVSGLISSHEAPIDGYQPEYEKSQTSNSDRIYYFRVRTALDGQGNVLSAHYGKIYGDFMQFRYYFNPAPNDRNVEFDPKQNLLGGLQSFEEVNAP